MSVPVINFPPFRPYSNITPFTVRDGATYLTVLEELRNWLNTALVPHVDTEVANLVIAWEDNAATLLANVIAALNEQNDTVTAQLNAQNTSILAQLNEQNSAITAQLANQDSAITAQLADQNINIASQISTMTDYVDNAVQSIINSTIEVSDPVVYAILNDPASNTVNKVKNIITETAYEKNSLQISAKDFGAVGDGVTDDSIALQNFINYVTANSSNGFIPSGTYLISERIFIGESYSSRWKISGNGTTIVQSTDNEPIFVFKNELTSSFTLEGISFSWVNNQSAINTMAIAILFLPSGLTSFGYYNFTLENLSWNKGFIGITTLADGEFSNPPIWGFTIKKINHGALMTGPCIDLAIPTFGQPNGEIKSVYIRGDSYSGPGHKALINISNMSSINISNIEFNDCVSREIFIETCMVVNVSNIRSERGTYSGSYDGIWTISNSQVSVDGWELQSKTFSVGSSEWAYVWRIINTNSRFSVNGANYSRGTIVSSGNVAIYSSEGIISNVGTLVNDIPTIFYPFNDTENNLIQNNNAFEGRGIIVKEISGVDKTTVLDTDFISPPSNRTIVIVRNTTDNSAKLACRINGTWKYISLA